MIDEREIMAAYHRAISKHQKKTGVQYPLIRDSCVDDGRIYSATVGQPELLATYETKPNGGWQVTLR